MKRNKMLSVMVTVALGLSVASCGGGGAIDPPAAASAAADAAAVTAAPETVTVSDFKFRPDALDVPVGTTVIWTNKDTFVHTVTSGDFSGKTNVPDGTFDEKLPERGSTTEVTFDETGTFAYFCRQHNVMNARITVAAK